jgi:hypothetical protein
VLRGLVDVTRLETGRPIGRAVNVGALQAITVAGSGPLTRPNPISAYDAKRLTSEFRVIPHGLPSASTAPAVEVAMQHAKRDAAGIVSARDAAGKAPRPGLKDSGRGSGSAEFDARNDKSDSGRGRDANNTAKEKGHGNVSPNSADALYFSGDIAPVSARAGGSTFSSGGGSGVGGLVDSATSGEGSKKGGKK